MTASHSYRYMFSEGLMNEDYCSVFIERKEINALKI